MTDSDDYTPVPPIDQNQDHPPTPMPATDAHHKTLHKVLAPPQSPQAFYIDVVQPQLEILLDALRQLNAQVDQIRCEIDTLYTQQASIYSDVSL